MDKFAWERFFEDWAILIVVIFAALTPYIFAFLLYFGLCLAASMAGSEAARYEAEKAVIYRAGPKRP